MKKRTAVTIWKVSRIIVFTLAAVAIFAFPDFFRNAAAFVVGGVMIAFGLDDLLRIRFSGKNPRNFPSGLNAILSLFLALIMMTFFRNTSTDTAHLIKVCSIWAVWSITQEIYELYEIVHLFRERRLGIVSGLESLAIIVLSVLLLIDPREHLPMHIFILGVELILKYAFAVFYDFVYQRRLSRKKGGAEKKEEQG